MKLEDCSKEELIWLIEKRCFQTANDFEFDILMRRSAEYQKESQSWTEKANKALEEYFSLLSPYSGKPLLSAPDCVIHEAAAKMKLYKELIKKRDEIEKKYQKVENRIDEILKKG